MRRTIIIAALALGACGSEPVRSDNAASFVPPTTRPPTPVAGQAQQTPLTAYVGRYPGDAVGGVGFFDRTEVATTLGDLVGEDKVRRAFTGRDGPQTPIYAVGTQVASWGCEAQSCGERNWTIFVDTKGGAGAACYHDGATMGETSRWYARGAAPKTKAGACPSEADAARNAEKNHA